MTVTVNASRARRFAVPQGVLLAVLSLVTFFRSVYILSTNEHAKRGEWRFSYVRDIEMFFLGIGSLINFLMASFSLVGIVKAEHSLAPLIGLIVANGVAVALCVAGSMVFRAKFHGALQSVDVLTLVLIVAMVVVAASYPAAFCCHLRRPARPPGRHDGHVASQQQLQHQHYASRPPPRGGRAGPAHPGGGGSSSNGPERAAEHRDDVNVEALTAA